MDPSPMPPVDLDALLAAADQAQKHAWSPYSGFRVGAALLCADGSTVAGCNVENASYGLTLCAERVAVSRAVACGQRDFVAIAITCDGDATALPCGACRQVLAEFAGPDLAVVARGRAGERVDSSLGELLPRPFGPRDLGAASGRRER